MEIGISLVWKIKASLVWKTEVSLVWEIEVSLGWEEIRNVVFPENRVIVLVTRACWKRQNRLSERFLVYVQLLGKT